ncbi:hypothetical protein BMW22_15950 [Rhizobium leguminosarum]|uniref:Phage ABA sandwich domain-containing protein n=1 Tax=Rhizobium leguminosarum TaxID=384 RepID=A0A1L3ZB80_RHILE|nr:hypothetical protein [Rhizobium leguminosarum]API52915.1 hypothetical protein BMW22_15950 [Rhizobium leguminosarum]
MTLSELIEALENATRPDREIDAQIWLLLTEGATRSTSHIVSATNAWPHFDIDETRDSSGRLITVPAYTASVDAAMDLAVAKVDDGATDIEVAYRSVDGNPHGRAEICGPTVFGMAKSKTPAMALVLATLKAIQAKLADAALRDQGTAPQEPRP